MSRQDVMLMQTADPIFYHRMLSITSICNRSYCHRFGLGYESYVGIKRGAHPWQAAFNRIVMLHELIQSGHRGWVLYMDADAYVYDHAFDIRGYLSEHWSKACIFGAGGLTGERWDVNSGAFLINLGHHSAKRLVQLWWDNFLTTSDQELIEASGWEMVQSDQPRLHDILRTNPDFSDDVLIESREFFNSYKASFVRQMLRGVPELSMDKRCAAISEDLREIFARHPPAHSSLLDEYAGAGEVSPTVVSIAPLIKLISELECANQESVKRLEAQAVRMEHYTTVNRSLKSALNLVVPSYGRLQSLFSCKSVLRSVANLLARHEADCNTQGDFDVVRSIYLGILRREPDIPGGLHLSKALAAGLPLSDALRGMIQSDEFRQMMSRPTSEEAQA